MSLSNKQDVTFGEENTSILRKHRIGLKTLFYALLSVGSALVGGLLFRVLVFRSIGTYETGILTLALSVITMTSMVVALGIPTAITRFVSAKSNPYEQSFYILTGAILLLVQGILILFILAIIMPWMSDWLHTPQLLKFRWIIVIAVLLNAVSSFWEGVYNGMMRFDIKAGIILTNQGMRFLVALGLWFLGVVTAKLGLVAVLGGGLVANLWGVRLAWKLWRQWRGKFDWSCAKELSSFGLYQFGAIIMDQVTYNSGILFIGRFLTPNEVGLYAVATLLGQLVLILPSAVQMLTYPKMTEYWEHQNKKRLDYMINATIRMSLVMLTPLVFTLSYLRAEVILLVFGASFTEAAAPLSILLVGYLFNSVFSRPLGASMAAIGRPNMDMVRSFLAAVVNVSLNLWFIPRWGLVGAAWATTLSLITTSCIFQVLLMKLTGIFLSKRPLVVAILLCVVIWLLYWPVITAAVWRWVFGISGGILLMVFGIIWGLTHTDRSYWVAEYRRIKGKG